MGAAIGQAATGQHSPRRRRHLSDASVSRLVNFGLYIRNFAVLCK